MNIAIVPARSGSKGLNDKNIKKLGNKPLMAYSIEAAIESKLFDAIMVSTDSELYADVAREYGAQVPFLRSKRTSSDDASSWDVIKEVIEGYNSKGEHVDVFCLLQPTSPLRTAEDIKAAYDIFVERDAIAVISMCEMEHPINWCGKIDDSLSIDGFSDRDSEGRRQLQEKWYRPNGAIYIAKVDELYKDEFFYRKGGYAYIMPQERSIDIDNEIDFEIAELMINRRKNGIK